MFPRPVIIIDGLNFFLRHFVVNPTMDVNGENIGGCLGFLRGLKNLVRDLRAVRAVVCWDGQGGSLKRRGIYREYKAGRKPRVNRAFDIGETPDQARENMQMQYGRLRRYLELLGVTQLEVEGAEADDVIGFLCRGPFDGAEKVVVSTDKDFLQLVDTTTIVFSPSKKVYYGCAEVKERFGVLPENLVYARAMMYRADGADNIVGIPGLGEKTVVALFPFLAERPVELREVFEYAETHRDEKPKYRAVLDGRELVTQNVQLMQLTSTIMSPQTVRVVRGSLEKRVEVPNATALKFAFLKDGVQLADGDFFAIFRELALTAEREGTENV